MTEKVNEEHMHVIVLQSITCDLVCICKKKKAFRFVWDIFKRFLNFKCW